MGVMDRYNKKKKDESSENQSSKIGVQQRYEWAKNNGGRFEVTQDTINAFITDANTFLSSAEEEYGGIGWSNASDVYSARSSKSSDLGFRSAMIRNWLDSKKDSIDEETYKSLASTLDSIDTGVATVNEGFKSAMDFYSSFETEDAYNKYVSRQQEAKRLAGVGDKDSEYYDPEFEAYSVSGGAIPYTDFGEKTVHYGKGAAKASSIDKYRAAAVALYEHGGNETPEGYDKYGLVDKFRGMTDAEFATLAYYLGKDQNLAKQYIDSIEESLNYREATSMFEDMEGKWALELLFGVEAGLDQFATGMENLFSSKDYIPTSSTQLASQMVREDLGGGDFKILGNSIGQIAYDAITTTSNMLPSILASTAVNLVAPGAGAAVGAGLLGASASGNAYAEMLNLGYDKGQARFYSALVGASEAGLQYLLGGVASLGGGPLKNLGTKALSKIDNALARVAISVGKEMVSEGVEEGLQTVLESWFKSIATGMDFDAPDIDEVLYSSLLGAISAAGIGGVSTIGGEAVANYKASKMYGDVSQDLINEALEIGGGASELATKYQSRLNDKKSLTGAQLRRLVETNEQGIRTNDTTKIASAAEARLAELGETGDVKALASILAKQASGESLSPAEKATLKNSKYGQRVSNELNPDNVTSGQYTSDWARNIGTDRINDDVYNLAEEVAGVTPTEKRPINVVPYDEDEDESTSAQKNATEAKFEASEEGYTIYNGENVTIKEIASVKDGEITLRLDNGETVNASDVSFGSHEEALVYEMVARMGVGADTANELVAGFTTGNTPAMMYAADAPLAYQYGKINYERGLSELQIPEAQKRIAYNRGRIDAMTDANDRTKAPAVLKATSAKPKKNGIIYEDFEYNSKTATDIQKASIKGIEALAKLSPTLEFHVYRSELKDGARVAYIDGALVEAAPNGYFTDGNKIYIDLNAGNKGQGAMLYTLSHEISHYIRAWNAEGFKTLADFLLEKYGENDAPVDSLIEKQREKIEKRLEREGKSLPSETKLSDMAYEELVADAMSTMLADPKAYEKLAELKMQNPNVFNKLGEAIKKVLDKLKSLLGIYKEETPDAREAQYVSEFANDVYEKLQDLYLKAFVEAEANHAAAEKTLVENGIAVNEETDSATLLSVRDVLSDEQRKKVSTALATRFGVTQQEAMDWLKAETSMASLILNPKYSQYLDYTPDPNEVAIKQNSDYPQGTVDFSPICAKRREFTSVMNNILRLFPNHVFAATDLAKIRTIMQEEGMTIPCGICYVEDRRQLDTIVAQNFIDSLKLYREGSKTRPDGKPFNANQLKGLSLIDGDSYTPSVYELVSLEGLNVLKAKNPNMAEAWVKFNNARGMQSVRLLANEAEYKRQILKYSKKTVQSKNDHGGLRVYSFSDAEMFHLIDIIQVITDSATVGLYLQGYTKVNEYARTVKDTGEKLNRSLIPKGELGYHIEDGNVILDYDTVEGIDINHPDFFDNKDNPDVGNITIGVSDVQIRAAMVSDFVDQIIPFHTGQSDEVLGEKGIATWSNYKDFQTEKDIATGKVSEHQINIYTEVLQVLEKEGKPITKRTFVEKFLQVCKENGLTPRFSQFLNTNEKGEYVYTEGYHKMLVDFKTFAQTEVGEYLPQRAVKPIFDNEYITKILKDYVKSQKVKDAELAESMPKVIERITNEIVKADDTKFSDRDPYSYETLTSKPDMKLTTVGGTVPSNRADVVAEAKKNAAKVGKVNPKDGSVSVHVDDIDTDVVVTKRSLVHGLDRRASTQAPVLVKVGEVLKNSIKINELTPRAGEVKNTYVLIGAAQGQDGILYVASFVVNKYSNEVAEIDVLYSANAKKETAALLPKVTDNSATPTVSSISVAQLLDYVNRQFPDILPESVLRHYGHDARPEGKLGESALYSDRDSDSISTRSLLANALEGAAQNEIERQKLAQYKSKIALIEAEQKKLSEIRLKIRELSFAKGPRDTEQIRSLQFEEKQTANRINTYDRQLLNLQSTTALKNVLEREKKLAYEKAKKEGKQALANYREKAAATQRELITRWQDSRKNAIEGRHKTEMRNKIKAIAKELDTLLRKPTGKTYIMEELRKGVADALMAINMDTVGADERVAKYDALIAKAKDPDVIAELTKTRDRIQLQGDNLKEKLDALRMAYERIKDSEDIELSMAYQEVIKNSIEAVSKKVGNTSIRNMTLEQLEMVYELYSMIRKTIRDANKAFKAKKGETITQMAEAVNDQVRTVGGQPYKRNAVSAAVQRTVWTFLKPFVAFRTIGSVTLTNLYKELRNGEDTFYGDVKDAQAFIEEQYEKHGFKSWDMKKTKTFTAKSGKSFDLTLEQMMSLYAYSRRDQAHAHIIEGGIVFEDAVIVEKKHGIPVKYEVTTKDAFNLSEETLVEIVNSLTAEQKAFVDAMQEYLSTTMGAKGNEVSMEMLGVKLFKEKFYLPIKSSQYYLNFSTEEAGEIKLKSPAFSKETVQHANNPIVLHNFTDLWAEHVNNMSMYHSFVLALEDFTRVYNYKTKTDEKVETMSTKQTIETAYPGATKYISNFLKSLNGGVRMDTVGFAEKLTSLAKKGAVLGSASVAIQQPSAVMRAMAVINPAYFIASAPKSLNLVKHKQDWEELKKYAPIAGIKEMGRFDVGMGKDTADWIKANGNVMTKIEDVLSVAPAFMDEVTWVSIWNAVKRETIHKHKNLSPRSDEFLKIAGERFTEVISLTQVYDSVFSRSDLMRNKSWIAKALTAFMAEPTTTLNMLYDSWVQGKRTGSKKGFVKVTTTTTGAVVASLVLNAALKSIVMAMRDDDEDESYAEKYLEHFFGDFKDSLNPLTLIPVAKDVVSIFKGYDVERMDMALFSDLKQAVDAFDSDTKTDYEKWSGFIGAVSSFFGLPVKNVERDIRGLITTIFGDSEETTTAGLLNAIVEGWKGEQKSNAQQLYDAVLSGDKEQVERIEGRFKDQDAANTALRKVIREKYEGGELSDQDAVDMLTQYADMSEDEAASRVQYWAFKQEYPDYDLTEAAVGKYYQYAEPSGISIDVYYDYTKKRAKCEGTDSDGDGKTDSGSMKREVMKVIDSLPISAKQKDALYFLNGWSEKTLYEAPWH